MKCRLGLIPAAVLFLASAVGTAGEMKQEVKVDRSNPRALQTLFGVYGYRPPQSVLREADGFRFRLPASSVGIAQTGAYSYFALAGDCEVKLTYELLNVPPPQKGYGSGVGLALDAGDGVGRGAIQRVYKTPEGSGYALQSVLTGTGGKAQDEYRFVPNSSRQGQIGLRRIKKELIFLASDSTTAPLEEIDRLPFTDRMIQAVRFFADTGGSPTAVDVRVRRIEVRAEEIAGGVPEMEQRPSRWWLWLFPAVGAVLLLWFWRARRRKAENEGETALSREARLKKT